MFVPFDQWTSFTSRSSLNKHIGTVHTTIPPNHYNVLSVIKDLLRKVALIRIFLLFMRGKNLSNVWLVMPVLPVEEAWKNTLTLCMKEKNRFIVPFVIPVLHDELAWKNMSALFIKNKITYHDIDVIFNILFISGQNGRS